MGCQTEIAGKIREAGADYVLAVKDNQLSLREEAEDTVRIVSPDRVITTTDIGHGRIVRKIVMGALRNKLYQSLSLIYKFHEVAVVKNVC